MLLILGGCGGGGGSTSQTQNSESGDSGSTPMTVTPPQGFTAFVYPIAGQLSVDGSKAFQWGSVSGASAYQLQLGSSRGANDIFDSGPISPTSVTVTGLPSSGIVYARVRVIPQGWSTSLQAGEFPRGTYATFRVDANVSGAAITQPAPDATLNADQPLTWQADPVATGYKLTLTGSDGGTLLDTGIIHTTLRVVRNLPAGAAVQATLTTYYSQNLTRTQSTNFTVGTPSVSVAGMLALARSMAGTVRLMADIDNQPFDDTALLSTALAASEGAADCVAFSNTLMAQFSDAGFPLQTRTRGVCYNYPDCHELVEVYDPDNARWDPVDPTFGLYPLSASGEPATIEDMSSAARAQAFSTLSYTFLTPNGSSYAKAYYLDYPLLFLDLYQVGSSTTFEQAAPASLEPFLDLVGNVTTSPVSGFYTIQCASGSSSANGTWDGALQTYACTNGFTPIAYGINVSLVSGDSSATAIWSPHRFVF